MDTQHIRIMIVDDDPMILAGANRLLYKYFKIFTFEDPMKALKSLETDGPFAVVVSDMHMPGIDGISFLSKVKERSPDTVRMMLTGDSDLQTAVDAVNEGHIFRFMTKPCDGKTLANSILVGIQQHQLITGEKELLEKTLKGSIQVMMDVMGMTNPLAFNKTRRVQHIVVHMAAFFHLEEQWKYELAAMLSLLGSVIVPVPVLEKYLAGRELTQEEAEIIRSFPKTGQALLNSIPRMGSVAEIIGNQLKIINPPYMNTISGKDPVETGVLLLKMAFEFDSYLTGGVAKPEAIRRFISNNNDAAVFAECLMRLELAGGDDINLNTTFIDIVDLKDGMVLAENIYSQSGMLVVGEHCIVNATIRLRLLNFSRQGIIPHRVKIITT